MKSIKEQPQKISAYTNTWYYCTPFITHPNPQLEWLALNFDQNFNSREKTFRTFNNSNYKIGKNNMLSNRLVVLNNKIEIDWLNKEKNSYKLLCKQKFIVTVWKMHKNLWFQVSIHFTMFSILSNRNLKNNSINVVHSYKMYKQCMLECTNKQIETELNAKAILPNLRTAPKQLRRNKVMARSKISPWLPDWQKSFF